MSPDSIKIGETYITTFDKCFLIKSKKELYGIIFLYGYYIGQYGNLERIAYYKIKF